MKHNRGYAKLKREKKVRKMLSEYYNAQESELVPVEKPYQNGYKFRIILNERTTSGIKEQLKKDLIYVVTHFTNSTTSAKKNPKWLKKYTVYTDTVDKWDEFHYGLFSIIHARMYSDLADSIASMYTPVNKFDKHTGTSYPTVFELKAEFRHYFRLQRRKNMIEWKQVPIPDGESRRAKLYTKLWKEGEARFAVGNTASSRLDDKEWRINASKRRDFRRDGGEEDE